MTPSSEATPRPWSEGEDLYDVPAICAGYEIIARFTHTATQKARALADRALTLTAVNSYDESRALLREAASWIDGAILESPSGDTSNKQANIVARIRAHLEVGK